MKKRFIAFALLIACAALAACGGQITSGEVVAKKFTPAHYESGVRPVMVASENGLSTAFVPYVDHYGDAWTIAIQAADETAEYSVTEEVYNSVEIGERFTYTDECAP